MTWKSKGAGHVYISVIAGDIHVSLRDQDGMQRVYGQQTLTPAEADTIALRLIRAAHIAREMAKGKEAA